ncbi:hypothetical protein, partial [Nocardioides malaquae]|uniref:hypothetical protein n=1 Tax=Nocardioides malaquae TaxID=2773426 RepID=UPI001D0D623D
HAQSRAALPVVVQNIVQPCENMAEREVHRTCSVNTADEKRESIGAVSMDVDKTATVIINPFTKKRDGARVYDKKTTT